MTDDPVDEFTNVEFITSARALELYQDGKVDGHEVVGLYHTEEEILFCNYGSPPWTKPKVIPVVKPLHGWEF